MGLLHKKLAAAASNFTRVSGKSTEQIISLTESILHSITISGHGAVGTLVVSNGPAATAANILKQLEIGNGESETILFGTKMSNGIRVTPGETTTDIVVIHDDSIEKFVPILVINISETISITESSNLA